MEELEVVDASEVELFPEGLSPSVVCLACIFKFASHSEMTPLTEQVYPFHSHFVVLEEFCLNFEHSADVERAVSALLFSSFDVGIP